MPTKSEIWNAYNHALNALPPEVLGEVVASEIQVTEKTLRVVLRVERGGMIFQAFRVDPTVLLRASKLPISTHADITWRVLATQLGYEIPDVPLAV